MNADRPVAFVDTNVLVYAFEKTNSERKQIAGRLLDELAAESRLRLSTQVLQELFVTLTRKVRRPCSYAEALSVIEILAGWPVTVVDVPAIRAAVELSGTARISFWDALIVVAATRSGAQLLYAEDLNHGQDILGVKIVNPFTAAGL